MLFNRFVAVFILLAFMFSELEILSRVCRNELASSIERKQIEYIIDQIPRMIDLLSKYWLVEFAN